MKVSKKMKVKTGKPSRRDLIKVADKMISDLIRVRDGGKCQRCGRPGNNASVVGK